MPRRSLLEEEGPIRLVDRLSSKEPQPGGVSATDDHDVIREWAARHSAEPATGEAMRSGSATLDVEDEGAGIRFNFPAAARFRPISREEWFQNFTQHDLMFVYENELPGEPPRYRFRLVPRQKLREQKLR